MNQHKTILITGASKGIGFETSQRLAKQNYTIIGIARSKPVHFPGHFFSCDLSSSEETAQCIEEIANGHQVHAIVNNVGTVEPQPIGQVNLDMLDQVYNLNVRAAVQVTQFFLESMKKNQWGRIINIASRAIFGIENRTSYAAAKSALVGCTRVWALELATFGITVNAIAPGPIETELFRKMRPKGSPLEKELLQYIPMKRFGKPANIAATIEFLLTDDAGFITGQTICVDGGATLRA